MHAERKLVRNIAKQGSRTPPPVNDLTPSTFHISMSINAKGFLGSWLRSQVTKMF
jgi:hypothetical protein